MSVFKLTDFTLAGGANNFYGVTSIETKIMTLNHAIAGYPKDSKWLVKDNPFPWIAHEYISSKLYQWALGKKYISDTILVQRTDKNYPLIATKLMDDYETNFLPFLIHGTDFATLDAGFPFLCLIESCPKVKPMVGFEKAFIASHLFVDGDTVKGNNYALIKVSNSFAVTRFDFDDSLKFLEYWEITDNIYNPSGNFLTDVLSQTYNYFGSFLLGSSSVYKEFNWYSSYVTTGLFKSEDVWKEVNGKKFIKALDDLQKLDSNQIKTIVADAISDITAIVDEDIFIKNYDFNRLDALTNNIQLEEKYSQKLGNFISEVIIKNFNKLENMKICLQVETAIKEHDIQQLKLLHNLHKENPINTLECSSFYQPLTNGGDDAQALALFIALYGNDGNDKTLSCFWWPSRCEE